MENDQLFIEQQLSQKYPDIVSEFQQGYKEISTFENQGFGDEQAQLIALLLEKAENLEYLSLKGNKIGETGAIALAGALQLDETLTTLDLRNNNIGESGLKTIVESLEPNKTLKTLLLDGNPVSPSVLKDLEKVFLLKDRLSSETSDN